jgi:hypothetical protein
VATRAAWLEGLGGVIVMGLFGAVYFTTGDMGYAAAAFLLGALVLAVLHHDAAKREWAALAETLFLTPGEGRRMLDAQPPLTGRHGHRALRLRTWAARNDEPRWTVVELAVAGVDPSFRFRVSKGVAASLAKALGGQDVEVGDEAFDKAFRVEASDPERVRRVLGPTFRHLLLASALPVEVRLDPAAGIEAPPLLARLVRDRGLEPSFLRAALDGPEPGASTLRWGFQGPRPGPEAIREALSLLARIADAVEAEAPREAPPETR